SSGSNELVDREPRLRTVAHPEPANTGRKPLEGDPLGRQAQPALENRVTRKEPLQFRVDDGDVLGLATEDRPPERTDSSAEERADRGRKKAGLCDRTP